MRVPIRTRPRLLPLTYTNGHNPTSNAVDPHSSRSPAQSITELKSRHAGLLKGLRQEADSLKAALRAPQVPLQ